jgi:hypothetical protein
MGDVMDYLGYIIKREGRDWGVYDWDYEVGNILKYVGKSKLAAMVWVEQRGL